MNASDIAITLLHRASAHVPADTAAQSLITRLLWFMEPSEAWTAQSWQECCDEAREYLNGKGINMDEYTLSKQIAQKYRLTQETVSKMIRIEAEAEQRDRKTKYQSAVEIAAGRIDEWLSSADEYAVDVTSLEDLARFVASHRTACVWAVLMGKALAKERELV